MAKIDFDKEMQAIFQGLPQKEKLLLHSCCGPCSSSVLERLVQHFEVTLFYTNSNIWPHEEYIRRKDEQQKLLSEFIPENTISFVEEEYNHEEYLKLIGGLESKPEGGARCAVCFEMRLSAAAKYAKEHNFVWFASTLSVSPHKNAEVLNAIGLKIAAEQGLCYLVSDFKKQDGYKRSLELSKEYKMYRQDYCGCEFSFRQKRRSE